MPGTVPFIILGGQSRLCPILFNPPTDLAYLGPKAPFTGELPGLLGALECAQGLRAEE